MSRHRAPRVGEAERDPMVLRPTSAVPDTGWFLRNCDPSRRGSGRSGSLQPRTGPETTTTARTSLPSSTSLGNTPGASSANTGTVTSSRVQAPRLPRSPPEFPPRRRARPQPQPQPLCSRGPVVSPYVQATQYWEVRKSLTCTRALLTRIKPISESFEFSLRRSYTALSSRT